MSEKANQFRHFVCYPSAMAERGLACARLWRAAGYEVLIMIDADQSFDTGGDAGIHVMRCAVTPFPGYYRVANAIAREAFRLGAEVVTFAGDDMEPPVQGAQAHALLYFRRFPEGYGVMQCTGDRQGISTLGRPASERICGSPTFGPEWCDRAFGKRGPFPDEYKSLYADELLLEVTKRLGLLYQEPALTIFHRHWLWHGNRQRYNDVSEANRDHDRALFRRAQAENFRSYLSQFSPSPKPMKLVSLTICRNSEWCIEATLRAALRWCDAAVVLNHASDDDTLQILTRLQTEFRERITIIHESNPVWSEMRHRQRTLEHARRLGATHCAIVDDDEILCETLVPTIRDRIAALAPGEVLAIPWLMLWRSLDRYRVDPHSVFARSHVTMAFADAPHLRWEPTDGYEHHARAPRGGVITRERPVNGGGVMHFQHANWRRLVAKQTWYQMMELCRWPEFGVEKIRRRYLPTLDERGLTTQPVPASWWGPEKALIQIDAEPWQERDMRRMISEKGRDYFAGILPPAEPPRAQMQGVIA